VILWRDLTFWTAVGQLGVGIIAGLAIGLIAREARHLARPPLTPLPDGGICPACGSRSVRRIHGASADRVVSIFTRRWPYGCRRCGWLSTSRTSRSASRRRPLARPTPDPGPRPTVLDADSIVPRETERAVARDDVADVRAVVLRYMAMLNSGDVAARAKCHLSDSTGLDLNGERLVADGLDWRASALEAGQVYDLRCRDLRIYIHKDTAIATAYLVGAVSAGSSSTRVTGRSSWVHLRQDGEWKLAHAHLSSFTPDSSGPLS
jgi:ketosteroid isomerase-like protein